ncbi:MAG: sulfate ABC transporter substrate-binding protein [Leptospiraceae bacterium]|nr:sulfate ABC transporter substrate-binding protein [Leptospiraceae bacterium]
MKKGFGKILFSVLTLTLVTSVLGKDYTLLNVSYDPTRELYVEYNKMFVKYWKSKTGDDVRINQSHGGSGKQARSVIDGLDADIVTLALSYDIDVIASKGLTSKDWQKSLPNNSSPYTSTIVFLVRKGNPKAIKDWEDLVKSGIKVVTANPKTSGGARWNYLAAWGYAEKKFKNDSSKVKEFIKTLYKNVPVLDSGARGSTTTFANNGIGDVLLAWENEAFLVQNEMGKDKFEVVFPSLSILAEPPVAVVEKNADRKGNIEVAKAYLQSLYSEPAQEIIAKNGYRPRNEKILKKFESKFPKIELLTIDKNFGGWSKAHKDHFADGASFDQLYVK